MNLRLSLALGAGIAAVVLGAACDNSDLPIAGGTGGAPADDGGAGDGASGDVADAWVREEGGPAAPPDAKLLVEGDMFLCGITADGFVVFIANKDGDGPLNIVPIGGGSPTQLAPAVHFTHVVVKGRGVAFWTNVVGAPLNGTLSLWSAASGLKANLGNTLAGEAIFNESATRVALFVNPRPFADPPLMDVAVTDVGAVSLTPTITDLNLTDNVDQQVTCVPHHAFVGNRFFMTHCTVARPTTSIMQMVSDANVVTTVFDNAAAPTASTIQSSFSLDANGERIFVIGTNGTARVVTLATSESVTIDSSVRRVILAKSGTYGLYIKESPPPLPDFPNVFSLRRTSTLVPDPRLVADNIDDDPDNLLAVSSDLGAVMFKVDEPLGDWRTNVNFVDSSKDPATAVPLTNESTGLPVGFVGDGRYALYMSDLPGAGPRIGRLKVHDGTVSGGAADRVVSATAMAAVPMPSGTKGLYCDDVQIATVPGTRTHCDLMAFDAASSSSPVRLATDADPFFYVSGTQVAFVLSFGANKGLYVKNVP